MKTIVLSTIFSVACLANLNTINQFEADFTQTIVNDSNKSVVYKGSIQASKPQMAHWKYMTPVVKDIYIRDNKIVIIEPELEQAVLKRMDGNFDFFSMINHARKVRKNVYEAKYHEKHFFIVTKNNKIETITYHDEFDNKVVIHFSNEKINHPIKNEVFNAVIPKDFDVIME